MIENDRIDWNASATVPKTASPKTITTNTPMVDAPAVSGTETKAKPLPHRRKK